MTTLTEKQILLNDIRSLMSRVEAMETQQINTLPFPEERTTAPERASRTRATDGSMYIRPFTRFLSKRYGMEIDCNTIRKVLKFLKADCNSKNSSHDWHIKPEMVKAVTDLFDIFYLTTTNTK